MNVEMLEDVEDVVVPYGKIELQGNETNQLKNILEAITNVAYPIFVEELTKRLSVLHDFYVIKDKTRRTSLHTFVQVLEFDTTSNHLWLYHLLEESQLLVEKFLNFQTLVTIDETVSIYCPQEILATEQLKGMAQVDKDYALSYEERESAFLKQIIPLSTLLTSRISGYDPITHEPEHYQLLNTSFNQKLAFDVCEAFTSTSKEERIKWLEEQLEVDYDLIKRTDKKRTNHLSMSEKEWLNNELTSRQLNRDDYSMMITLIDLFQKS